MKNPPKMPPCDEAGIYKDPDNRRFQVLPEYSWLEATPPGVPTAALKDIQAHSGPATCFVQLKPRFDVGLAKGHRPVQLVPREVFQALVKKKIYVPEDRIANRSISARRRKMLLNELEQALQHKQPQAAGQAPVERAAAPTVGIDTRHKGRKAKPLTAG